MRRKLFSIAYRLTRLILKQIVFGFQRLTRRPEDLETVVTLGDSALKQMMWMRPLLFRFPLPKNHLTELYDLRFLSPLLFSSFKGEPFVLDMWLEMGMGGGIFKTIMREQRSGNPRPRLLEVSDGRRPALINALGLPGKGIDTFLSELPEFPWFAKDRPLGISIGGNSVGDYLEVLKSASEHMTNWPDQWFFEMNISCPNTPKGQAMTEHPHLLEKLLKDARKLTNRVIGIKVTPDQPDDTLLTISEIAKSVPKVYINAGNTSFRQHSGLSKGGGGLSGAPLFKRTLEMSRLFKDQNIPIIATGGISSSQHIHALSENGVRLFGLATALVLDPYCIPQLNRSF